MILQNTPQWTCNLMILQGQVSSNPPSHQGTHCFFELGTDIHHSSWKALFWRMGSSWVVATALGFQDIRLAAVERRMGRRCRCLGPAGSKDIDRWPTNTERLSPAGRPSPASKLTPLCVVFMCFLKYHAWKEDYNHNGSICGTCVWPTLHD